MDRIYLDYNATCPLRPEARDAALTAMAAGGNPSSIHGEGRSARKRLETARRQVAALVGGRSQDVTFTSGASEAASQVFAASGDHIQIVSSIEHECMLQNASAAAIKVPATSNGVIDLEALAAILQQVPEGAAPLVATMAVNNETGVIQPILEIGALVRSAGGLLLVDAVQAVGRVPVDVKAWDVDILILSGHKLGGPIGSGAMITRPGLTVSPFIRGGGQERRRRAGTEAVGPHAGFGAAAEAALSALDEQNALALRRDRMEQRLRRSIPGLTVWGERAPRVAGVSCLGIPGMRAETLLMQLDMAGFAVSAGSACSSGKVAASPVLLAMGADARDAESSIRISGGWATGPDDFDRIAHELIRITGRSAA